MSAGGRTGVGTDVEDALPGSEGDRLEQLLHRLPLSSPVAALVVRKAEHPGPISAVHSLARCYPASWSVESHLTRIHPKITHFRG
jgi:hypothetical protein